MRWVKVLNKVNGYTFKRYVINERGELKDTVTGKLRRPGKSDTGHYYTLFPDQHTHGVKDGIGVVNISVAVIMAESFKLKKPKRVKCRTMHLNGDKYDDRLDNIAYRPVGDIIEKAWEKRKDN